MVWVVALDSGKYRQHLVVFISEDVVYAAEYSWCPAFLFVLLCFVLVLLLGEPGSPALCGLGDKDAKNKHLPNSSDRTNYRVDCLVSSTPRRCIYSATSWTNRNLPMITQGYFLQRN